MQLLKITLACLLLCTAGVGDALADRWHGGARVGVVIGPTWGPYYPSPVYYPPYSPYPSYYPPVVVTQPAPPVYVEQTEPPIAERPAPAPHYWYYCAASKGYYPYVKTCPRGWVEVAPVPPRHP